MVGGGADYRLASHWVGRFKVDFLRTHFADDGQSRIASRLRYRVHIRGKGGKRRPPRPSGRADEELAEAEAQKKAMEQARCEKCKKQARTEAEEEKRPTRLLRPSGKRMRN